VEGIRYALGEGSPDVATRPLPVALGRLRKSIFSPVTKIDADEFVLVPVPDDDEKPSPKEDALAARKRILQEAKARIEKAEASKKEMKAAIKPAQAGKLTPGPPQPPSPPKVAAPQVQPPKFPPPAIDFPTRPETPKSDFRKMDFSFFNPKVGPASMEKDTKLEKMEKIDRKVLESAGEAAKSSTRPPTLEIPKLSFPQPNLELPKVDKMPTNRSKPVSTAKDAAEAQKSVQKQKIELLQKKQDEVKRRIAVEAEKKRLAAEEARRKRMEAQQKFMEEKRAAAEEQKRVQAEARQKEEQSRQSIALKNAEDRRRKLDDQRQAQVAARKKQDDDLKAAKDKDKAKAELRKPSATRPSISVQRPSSQNPNPRRPSFSLPRPSLQIPKPTPPQSTPNPLVRAPKVEMRPSFSLPRPSLSIPKTKLDRAPTGVPTVVGWSVRSDGESLNGLITMLPNVLLTERGRL
jgi:hypothetical protein